MITRIKNGLLVLPESIAENLYIYIENGKIINVTERELPFDKEIDAEGLYVSPGFIDMHVHGGGGYDFMDGGGEPIEKAALFHLKHGTTSILATSLACSTPVLIEFLRDLSAVMETKKAPNLMGAHLEGPYFSLSQSGAQNPDYIKEPDPREYIAIIETGKGNIKKWSFAPELSGVEDFCQCILKAKIVPSVGHSDAVYSQVKKIYDAGCQSFTHLYSGMSTITREKGFRRLGVIESAYLLEDVQAEIIADGKHLPPELLQLIVKQLGADHIALVTDAMRGAGMPDGESLLGRKDEAMPCLIEDGVAKLLDKSAFAGSVATADRLVRTMVKEANVSLCDAVKMMTVNPAKLLNFREKGKLAENFDADILFFDENINIKKIFVKGEEMAHF
ncbi:MAG: N-acetylglucosamine-6-phosphate deacetylase [Ruminococcaceae bacterium]|nr:N-acetylglucosamine-6-phosphate deacetylase [Oscillospiraceae bacterium]